MKKLFFSAKELLFLIGFTVLSVLIRGYTYRGTFMLPYSYHYLDSALFSKDIAFFPYDLNFFFLVNAHLSKFISYENMFFIGYVISSFLLVLGVYLLSTTLFEKKEIGYLAVLLIILVKPALSAMTTVWTYYYYKDLAMGIMLISLAFFLRKRYVLSCSLLGVASLLHILFSLYFVAFYGLFFLCTLLSSKLAIYRNITVVDRKRMLIGFGILGLFLAGPVYLILSSEQPANSANEMTAWFDILRMRSFDHFFPSTWITNSVLVFMPLLGLFLLYLFVLYSRKKYFESINAEVEGNTGRDTLSKYRVEMGLFFILCIILGIMAIVFSEIIPVRMLTILQLFRPTILLTFFAICFGAFLIHYYWVQGLKNVRRGYFFLSLILFAGLFWYDFRMLLIAFVLLVMAMFEPQLVGFFGSKFGWIQKLIYVGVGGIFVLSVISFVFPSFLYVSYVGEQVFRFQDMTYVFLGLGMFIFGLDFILRKKVMIQYARAVTAFVLIVGVVVSGVIATRESTIHSDDPCYTAHGQFDFSEHLQYPTFPVTEHMKMALWAKTNTAKDALFLIPPECGSDFRNFGERSVFMDFKYGTMSTFSVNFGLEWWNRVLAINPDRKSYDHHTFYRNLVSDYGNMTEKHVQELALNYDIDYAVFRVDRKYSFPEVHRNEEYVVYDVRNNSIKKEIN